MNSQKNRKFPSTHLGIFKVVSYQNFKYHITISINTDYCYPLFIIILQICYLSFNEYLVK